MLRRTTAVIVLAALSGSSAARSEAPLASPEAGAGARSAAAAGLAHDVLLTLNRTRAARGARALSTSPALREAARAHSLQMSRRGFFQHESFDGTRWWRRIERFYPSRGFRRWAVGENLYWQPATQETDGRYVLRAWLQSRSHRRNLLDREWREAGIAVIEASSAPGVFNGGPVTIVTVDFGARLR